MLKKIKNFLTYINSFDVPTNYNVSLNIFNLMIKYIDDNDIFITPEIFTILSKNPVFNETLRFIVTYNLFAIEEGKLEKIFMNQTSISLIELYCLINNVEVKEDNTTEIPDDIYDKDSLNIYYNEITNTITPSEERRLGYLMLEGDKNARQKLIEGNLKLVIKSAKRYVGLSSLSLLDLIQEGNIGLMLAVDHFDVRKGVKLATYAKWWINQCISRAICYKSRNIKLSIKMNKKLYQYRSLIENDSLTIENLSKKFNISYSDYVILSQFCDDTISINQPVSGDINIEYSNLIPDDKINIENDLINNDIKKSLIDFLNSDLFTDRERCIMMYRYGFNNQEIKTFEEIAQMFGVSRQRVKQIEWRLLLTIMVSPEADSFAEYFDNSTEIKERLSYLRDKIQVNRCGRPIRKQSKSIEEFQEEAKRYVNSKKLTKD